MTPKINLLQAKTILTKSGLPDADWVVNPYNGCLFGCQYCYTAQIARWKHPNEEWGSFLDVKTNAPQLLKKELVRLKKKFSKKNFGFIFFSSVTDPYVGPEAKYKLTRRCLQVLADFDYQGGIGLQTKSPLITRDIDLFKRLKDVSVGLTVTSLDDRVSRFLEVNAPPVSVRLKALKKLSEASINTYAFVGPLLAHFVKDKKTINQILDKLQAAGVKEVWFEHINLSPKIKARLYAYLKKESPGLIAEFEKANTEKYRNQLEKVIQSCMKGRKLTMALGHVIHHRKLAKKK